MNPLVSILIPAYNAEHWIADTVRSAMAQTWPRKEIIIVDDGSRDQTLASARRFESDSVRVVSQRNQGAAAARNTALSLSRGDYIQWLDADDLLAPDKIERQLAARSAGVGTRTLLSGSWGHFLYRPSKARFLPSSLWTDLSPAEFLLRKLSERIYMQTAVWLVSRELSEAAGPWDTTMISDDDGEYFCRLLLASDGIRFVPEARVYYRIVGASSLSYVGQSNRKLEALWGSMQKHIRALRSLDDSARARAACVTYLQNYAIAFYPLRPDLLAEMRQSAHELGGDIPLPRLPWKYQWIQKTAGWHSAKRAQMFLPQLKWRVIRYWDKLAWQAEKERYSSDVV
ncbi:MAG TPA: glycosyltransferase [Bryobacteraceae bacterium]|jgi:glycosyltransferase involved in cell wall biosynthesis|nr:glycosyltransferase [Bryobacteraceae bacterium]